MTTPGPDPVKDAERVLRETQDRQLESFIRYQEALQNRRQHRGGR